MWIPAPNQFRFRPGIDTFDAIQTVMVKANSAAVDVTLWRHLCALVSLEVRNAFSSISWWHIDTVLQHKGILVYIYSLLWFVFFRIWLEFDSSGAQHRYLMTWEVPRVLCSDRSFGRCSTMAYFSSICRPGCLSLVMLTMWW